MTLLHLSDDEQAACLDAIRRIDSTATIERGVIICRIDARNATPGRRDNAARQLKRSMLTTIRQAIHKVRSDSSAASEQPIKPTAKQSRTKRKPRTRLTYEH